MKFASLVLSGLLLVVLAGCSSDGDSGRVSTLTETLALTQEELETAKGERDAAQSQLTTARNTLTTTQTELDEAEEDLETAESAQQAAQAEADAQQARADAQVQEEADAESITRAYGLLEAMDPATRVELPVGGGDIDDIDTGTDGDTNIARVHAATVLRATHPLSATHPADSHDAPHQPRISNNAPTIRQSATGSLQMTVRSDANKTVPEFTRTGGIPSLSLGGTSLSSTLLQHDELDNLEELAVYTNFRARNMRLLDLYTDYRRWVIGNTNETAPTTLVPGTHTKANEVRLGSPPLDDPAVAPVVTDNVLTRTGAVDVNEKMRTHIRTLNNRETDGMYRGVEPEVPALQPRLSGVTFEQSPYTLDAEDDYTVLSFELASAGTNAADTDDDTYYAVKSFNAALRGVQGSVKIRRTGTVDPSDGDAGMMNDDSICTRSPTPQACADAAGMFSPTFTINTRPSQTSTNPVRYEPSTYTLGTEGSWTFVPNSDGSTVWVDDGHYLYFGWWQVTPDQADGVYDFHVFANGVGRWRDGYIDRENTPAQPYLLRAADNVVYTGPAVGKYVRTLGAHDELDHADERRREAVAGIFTANARLEADFTEAGGTVEGLISNFMDEASGQAIPGRWQVALGTGDA